MTAHEAGIRLRPMGLGDLVDEGFALYRRHFLTWVVATAISAVPGAIVGTVLSQGFGLETPQTGVPSMQWVLAFLTVGLSLLLLSGLIHLVGSAATVQLASDAILGRPLDLGAAYRRALGRLLSLIWAAFLIGLATTLLAMTLLGIPFAIYLGMGWTLATQGIMVEGLGGSDAMSRSSALVDDHRFRMIGITILLGILVGVLTYVPAGLLGLVLGLINPSGPGTAPFAIVNSLASALITSLFGAITWITLTLLYYDLRVRKEALDLEQRAAPPEDLSTAQPA